MDKTTKVLKQKKEQSTPIDIRPFIRKYYKEGNIHDRLSTESIHSLCLDFYKESPEHHAYVSSITNFTRRLKEQWLLEFPHSPLITENIRDPNDKKKRGIACIKKKGS